MIAAAWKIEYLWISARGAPTFSLRCLFSISNGLMWKQTLCDTNGPHYGTRSDSYSNKALISILRSLCACIYYVEYHNALLIAIIGLKNETLSITWTNGITEYCFAHQTVTYDERQPFIWNLKLAVQVLVQFAIARSADLHFSSSAAFIYMVLYNIIVEKYRPIGRLYVNWNVGVAHANHNSIQIRYWYQTLALHA